ncbi:FHA domain-containing protein [Actinomadura viridis]|uniref:FHA domain-containing protein n=1 Tax=Actinomadura viridis TaxID=58110 RepID=UPI0036C57029
MPICPSGHTSTSADFCDVCGDLIPGAPRHRFDEEPGPSAGGTAADGEPGEECPMCGAPRSGRFCEEDAYDFETGAVSRTAQMFAESQRSEPPPSEPPSTPGMPSSRAALPGAPPSGAPSSGTPTPGAPSSGTPLPGTPAPPPRRPAPAPTMPLAAPVPLPAPPPAALSVPAQAEEEGGPAWSAAIVADRAYYDSVIALGGPDAASLAFPPYCPERRIRLDGEQVRIGRRSASRGIEPEIDLSVPPEDPGVSHVHAVLLARPGGSWALVDPGSMNGTTLNGGTEPIDVNVPVPVGDGDRIHVGAWTTIILSRTGGQPGGAPT